MGRFKINTALLPVKSHYFCFMAAMGPILPQMPVYGKEMGISSAVMGTVTGVLPVLFLLAKPAFGLLVDVHRARRKAIFVGVIVAMSASFALLHVLPPRAAPTTHDLNASCAADADADAGGARLYRTWQFWYFIALMSAGMIAFNVANSISDAVCFDVIGEEHDYGKQRVWGTVGFGATALVAGYCMSASDGGTSYAPAFLLMLAFTALDLVACSRLQLPAMAPPENIGRELRALLTNAHTVVFALFSICAGVLDGFIVYFLFWHLQDLAAEGRTARIKLVEGAIVAAETLGGEALFFAISGRVLARLGHAHCFSVCFVNYALRLGLLAAVPSPWWALPVELLLQGPTYALTYATIVAYANAVAPAGASATMQGIAAGLDDGVGYAIGSLLGGLLYQSVGGRAAFRAFSCFALVCGAAHLCLHQYFLRRRAPPPGKNAAVAYAPAAADATVSLP